MAKRNLTLSLEDDLIRRARIMAAQRDSSITAIVAKALDRELREGDERETYEQAMEGLLADMERGWNVPLTDHAPVPWSRDEAHER